MTQTPDELLTNQRVATRLRQARLMRGMKQHEVGARLRDLLGRDWQDASLKQIVNALERVAPHPETGEVRAERSFSVHEITLYARIFGVPAAWFLVDPDEGFDSAELAKALQTLNAAMAALDLDDEGSES